MRLARQQFGFTMIEVLVSFTLLAVGVLSMMSAFDFSLGTVRLSEHESAASTIGERELERLIGTPYAALALTSVSPNAEWDSVRAANATLATEADVVDASQGRVSAHSTWYDARTQQRGSIHRYVTWASDSACPDAKCPGTGDYKRVTVAVTVQRSQLKKPLVFAAIIPRRESGPAGVDVLGDPCREGATCGP